MTEAEALAELTLIVEASEEPVLDSTDLTSILQYGRRPDSDGYTYTDGTAAWTPTWDLNAAAAEGWRRKAAKAAGRFSFAEDNQRFDRAQVYSHCIAQSQEYARRAMGSIPIVSGTASSDATT